MGFKSFLSAIGHDTVAVFKYLASPAGQKTVLIAETAAVAAGTAVGGPALAAGISGINVLVNKGLADVFAMEASAAQVGAQSGTGVQKGVAVAASLTPQAAQLLKDLGYDNPTAEQVETIANAVSQGIASIVNSVPPPAALVPAVKAPGTVTAAVTAGMTAQGAA